MKKRRKKTNRRRRRILPATSVASSRRLPAVPLALGAELPQRRRPQRSLDLEKRRLAGGRSSQRRRGARRRRRTSLPRCSPEVGARRRAARPGGGSGEEREKREGKLSERGGLGIGVTWVGPEIDREFPLLRSPVKLVLRKECSIFPGRATRGRRREKALAYLREALPRWPRSRIRSESAAAGQQRPAFDSEMNWDRIRLVGR